MASLTFISTILAHEGVEKDEADAGAYIGGSARRSRISARQVMVRITVFGATGRSGGEIVRAARERGHAVTAHARRPPEVAEPGVDWASGEAGEAVIGSDAVLVAFGPRPPSEAPFCAADTGKILAGMARHGVNRLVCVTGAMVGDYPRNRTRVFQCLAAWIQRRYPELMEDRARQEALIRASGVNWTIFKPPRLRDGKPGGGVEVGAGVRAGLLSSISRMDLARTMVEEAEHGKFTRQCVFVKSGIRAWARVWRSRAVAER